MNGTPKIRRRSWKLSPDPSLVICRPNIPPGGPLRIEQLINRVMKLPVADASNLLDQVVLSFSDRHRHLHSILDRHAGLVDAYFPVGLKPDNTRRLLIGAYFTLEYSVASAALFNPSIVLHPDQTNLEEDSLRFIMSLRAVGEGHISSIVFRSGLISGNGKVLFDPESNYVDTPVRHIDSNFDKKLFELKLAEMNAANEITNYLLTHLPDQFSFTQLQQQIDTLFKEATFDSKLQTEAISAVNWLANSNYSLIFSGGHHISERVIFPVSDDNSRGIEDARFVQFSEDDGSLNYYATYTAYNGLHILPQLIETSDFEHFKIITLNGAAVQNKGMALFPRKINGLYVMLSRQDGVNNHIMYSDDLHFWQSALVIQQPTEPWEFVQLGNCGSPLETDKGWLMITHGVGPMRQYAIGAVLLALDDPSKIIARLKQPLLFPHEQEREGYVPNVVYSCGALIHHNDLFLPYAMSDISSGLASVKVQELIDSMDAVT